MSWDVARTIIEAVGFAAGAFSGWVSLRVRADISELRVEIAKDRAADRDETREWINGSFMRASTVEAKFHEIQGRLDRQQSRHS